MTVAGRGCPVGLGWISGPGGGGLGTLLFLIYINDLEGGIETLSLNLQMTQS